MKWWSYLLILVVPIIGSGYLAGTASGLVPNCSDSDLAILLAQLSGSLPFFGLLIFSSLGVASRTSPQRLTEKTLPTTPASDSLPPLPPRPPAPKGSGHPVLILKVKGEES